SLSWHPAYRAPPSFPTRRSSDLWTTASIKFLIGLILGLMLGGGLAFVLEALNTSIRRPEDIESALHIPGLAVIPRLTSGPGVGRSEEHTSELQSRSDLVCRLLLE